jgi:hypothetical protein
MRLPQYITTVTGVIAAMLAGAGAAGADPGTPQPPSPYQIQGPSGPVVGGLRTLPSICAAQPRACAGNWSPDTGSWVFPPGTG